MSTSSLDKLKEKLKNYAYSIGIDKIGFASAKPLENHLVRLMMRRSENYSYTLNEGDPLKRINPALSLPAAKSVICAAVAYDGQEYIPHDNSLGEAGARGRLSLISRGRDYHVVMHERLEKLKLYIMKVFPNAKISIMVDKHDILEKAFAVEAGLGWFGKNTLLVTPEFGSFVYLGELVTDIPFPADAPVNEGCGKCIKCLEACPTGALDKDRNLNPDRCIAGVSQYKGVIHNDLREAMGNTIYGCDICQIACPYNKRAVKDTLKDVSGSIVQSSAEYNDAFPLLTELFRITNSEFKSRFGHTAGAWRGRTVFQRNAIIAAGNQGNACLVPELTKFLKEDSRAVIRGAAAWALGRIGNSEAVSVLKAALLVERDENVLNEIKYSLKVN